MGCINSTQTGETVNEDNPLILISATIKQIEIIDKIIQNTQFEDSVAPLKIADANLDLMLFSLNESEETYIMKIDRVKKAKMDMDKVLHYSMLGDSLKARLYLDITRKEMLILNSTLYGSNETFLPERFSIQKQNRIPLTYYDYVDGDYIGYQAPAHNIALVAREAFYEYFKTDDEKSLENGLLLVDFLLNISTPADSGNFIVWENDFRWPAYNLSEGWKGSLSQAGVIKALMLAYQATDELKYKTSAEKAISAFNYDISDGGLRTIRIGDGEEYLWYPEYVRNEPPFVLNGFVTTVIWLDEYYEFTGYEPAKELSNAGIESLTHYLKDYDLMDAGTYYDVSGTIANEHYHNMHVEQMQTLYNITEREIFKNYHEKWRNATIIN